MDMIQIILIMALSSIIAAAPLGLVNLTVMGISHKEGLPPAMKIAGGAAIIEILFVSTAVFAGKLINDALHSFTWMQWLFIAIPVLTGLLFLWKKNRYKSASGQKKNHFLYGALLNLISVQVLLFWIFVYTFINNAFSIHEHINAGMLAVILFSVWLTKIVVLWVYAKLSHVILEKFNFIASRINQIIGFILIVTGILQYFKI